MTLISIRERGTLHPGPVVAFDGQEYPITLTDPFDQKAERRLAWYFEEHLRFPFTHTVRAREAADSIPPYGEALFNSVFADRKAYARYQAAIQQGIDSLTIEIAGSPAFHAYHWEALKDPDLPQPLALQATFFRRNLSPQTIHATLRTSPTINLLIVVARPGGAHDISYRTISRPLVTALRQANLRVRVEILRPGTYEALEKHLEAIQDQHGAGYYHVIHFDVHGALLPYEGYKEVEGALPTSSVTYHRRYGRPNLDQYAGHKAFLFLESDTPTAADPVEAGELARLLIHHQVPIAILNACQSGKQVGDSETSLASQLMTAGIQMVLAMRYSVTVTAAELMMRRLYEGLFAGRDLAAAIRSARLELYNRKERRVYFNQRIDLEDWLLPVVYQNQPQQLRPREFTPEEHAVFYQRQADRYPDATVTYEFVGRDLDILHIERRLLNRNILLVRGMGGAGKTTLLHHLAHWWQTTGWVDRVFYFGYDQRAYTRQQILHDIAQKLLGQADYVRFFQPLGEEAQQAFLADRLRGTRHLLILDNLESITGTALAILNTLPADEQAKLHRLLASIAGGKTFVLLGSRSGEAWLAPQTFVDNLYDLPGLDPEAASALADLILQRHGATKYREDVDFQKLLKLLDGYPLALEVVLTNLAYQTPADVLTALQAGDLGLDKPDAQDKTESIVQCIAYSHSNLDANAQQLLLCLMPSTGVLSTRWLAQYIQQLQAQPALVTLPLTQLPVVVQQAIDWGLLAPHPEMNGYLRIQPTLPYFLKTRLQQSDPALSTAIETAFRQHYKNMGVVLSQAIEDRAADQRRAGLALTQVEYENLSIALRMTLAAHAPISSLYRPLDGYLKATQQVQVGVLLGQNILTELEHRSPAILDDDDRFDRLCVLGDLGDRLRIRHHYIDAEAVYRRSLTLIDSFEQHTDQQKGLWKATAYHQLGYVAYEQRQFEQAEQHYQQALALKIKYSDRHGQASTYHQLGRVAQAQRQFEQAEQHYQKALALKIKYNDRYRQASTYHQLGSVAEEQRQFEQAEQHYQKALALKIEYNDRHGQASTYHNLGRVAEEQRQFEQAEQHYQKALALYIEFNDRYHQASTYGQLGYVAYEQRQFEQAEQHYQKALALKIEFNDRHGQAGTYHHLGMVAAEQRQYAQAEHYYQQALAILIEYNDHYGQARIYYELGRVAQAQRQFEQAEQYYQQALTLCIKYNDRYHQALVYYQLGMVAAEQRQYAQAEQHYQQALALYIEYNGRYGQALTYHQLGRVMEDQRQWAQAEVYFLQALTIFVDFEDDYNLKIVWYSLARIWRAGNLVNLPTAVAPILNTTPAEVEARFTQLLAPDKASDNDSTTA
jgi:tetratricopeptide (TPR) repeat protein